jgi:ABC-type transport system involved in multi-copper enzyme maturation permease subunit
VSKAATADAVARPMPPPVPGLGAAIAAVFRLQWKRIVRGKKIRLAVIAVVLIVAAVIALRYAIPEDAPSRVALSETERLTRVVSEGMRLGWFRLLGYLLPFLFTSGAIAEDVEGRTFTYVAARPVSRFAITVGRYLAGVAISIALLAISLLLVHFICYAADPTLIVDQLPETLRYAGAVSLQAVATGAICLLWSSLVVEAAGILATLHLALFEFVFSFFPSFLPLVSMNYHAMKLAGFTDDSLLASIQFSPEPWQSALAMVAFTLVLLGISVLAVSTSEYRSGKA